MKFFSSNLSPIAGLTTLFLFALNTISLPVMADTPEELIQIAKDYGVVWTLERCDRKSKIVSCTFSLSPTLDKGYWISVGATKFVDAEGTEYFAKKAKIGKFVAGSENQLNINLAIGSRYKTIIDFTDIPASATYATLLEVRTPTTEVSSGILRFRNVPFVNPDGTYADIPRPPKPTPPTTPAPPTSPKPITICLPFIGCL